MQQVMTAVAQSPMRRLRELDIETWQGIVDMLQQTDLFDATTLALPPKLAKWASGLGEETAALKLQMKVAGESGAVKQLLLTPGTGNDTGVFQMSWGRHICRHVAG